jgi:hypothetical protein
MALDDGHGKSLDCVEAVPIFVASAIIGFRG